MAIKIESNIVTDYNFIIQIFSGMDQGAYSYNIYSPDLTPVFLNYNKNSNWLGMHWYTSITNATNAALIFISENQFVKNQ